MHDFYLSLIAMVSEIVGTTSGFGSSTFFVPAAMLVESFHFVLALTAILHVVGNLSKLVFFRGTFPIKECIPLAIPSILFTGVGAALTSFISPDLLRLCLGFALMAIAVFQTFSKYSVSKKSRFALMAVSGFFTGLVGTGGALRGAALRSLRLDKFAFVYASAFIDFGGDAFRTVVYLKNGYMDWSQWHYIPLLIIAAIVGSTTGKWILSKINQTTFERIVTLFVFISGLLLCYPKLNA